MTNQVNLPIVWAETGGITDPTDAKYGLGWVAEIPTFQHFNFLLNALDSNSLSLAEKANWDYEATITYQPGASVRIASTGIVYYCHTVSTGNDPATDTLGNYWSTTPLFGLTGPTGNTAKNGLVISEPMSRTSGTTWSSSDLTVGNQLNGLMHFRSTTSGDGLLLGTVGGELVTVDVGTTQTPDGRNISKGTAGVSRIFHEGHVPTVSEVTDAVEEAPEDNLLYARTNSGWTKVTATLVQDTPPNLTGDGAGWYNLEDGQLYIDVYDGDTSQWVPASPALIPDNFATSAEINAGTNATKCMSPAALAGSKYVHEESNGFTYLNYSGNQRLATSNTGVGVNGALDLSASLTVNSSLAPTGGSIFMYGGQSHRIASASDGSFQLLERDQNGANEKTVIRCNHNGGPSLYYNNGQRLNVTSTGGTLIGTWTGTVTSDERLKENITVRDGLSNILALNGVDWEWKEGEEIEGADLSGFTAQNWESVYPDDVVEVDGVKQISRSIDTQVFDADLVEAIKAQQVQIEALLARIEVLEA
jgi:hypothetical protein